MPDFKDLIRLYHWSSQPDLKTLDPKYYGTGIPGQEAARVTNQGAPQRSYFYTSDRPPEPGLGQNRYFADVPRSDLYDLTQDPESIAADLRGQFTNAPDAQINPGVFNEAEHATAVEKALMERGYRGYIGANESAALFDPQDVTRVGYLGDEYPPVGVPEIAQDKRSGKEYLSKVQSPLYGLVGTAMASSLAPEEAEAGIMSTLSGYSDEVLRVMRQQALDEGKADEAASYAKELSRRSEEGIEVPPPPMPGRGAAGAAAGVGVLAAGQGEDAEAAPMGTLADQLRMATRQAFHGTPHKFDPIPENELGKFDLSKMGTGEGAQAYGYGAYLSSSKGIAKGYRDALTRRPEYRFKGAPVRPSDMNVLNAGGRHPAENAAIAQLIFSAGDVADARKMLQKQVAEAAEKTGVERFTYAGEALDRLDDVAKDFEFIEPKGHLYTAEIPAEDHLLDWDKPLAEQSDFIKDTAARLIAESAGATGDDLDAMIKVVRPQMETTEMTGKDFYRRHAVDPSTRIIDNPDKIASERLREMGIPGHTYKGRTSDERNYVMYDEDLINIVERGQVNPKLLPGLAGAGAVGAYAVGRGETSKQSDDFRSRVEDFRSRRDKKRNAGKDYMHAAAQMVGDVGSAIVGPSLAGIGNLAQQRSRMLTGNPMTMAEADANRGMFDYEPTGNPLTEKWREEAKGWAINFVREVMQQQAPQQALALAKEYDIPGLIESMGEKYNELPEDVRVLLESYADATDLVL